MRRVRGARQVDETSMLTSTCAHAEAIVKNGHPGTTVKLTLDYSHRRRKSDPECPVAACRPEKAKGGVGPSNPPQLSSHRTGSNQSGELRNRSSVAARPSNRDCGSAPFSKATVTRP